MLFYNQDDVLRSLLFCGTKNIHQVLLTFHSEVHRELSFALFCHLDFLFSILDEFEMTLLNDEAFLLFFYHKQEHVRDPSRACIGQHLF